MADQCIAVKDRGEGVRYRRVRCVKEQGHSGQHLASWGRSQKGSFVEWSNVADPVAADEPRPPNAPRTDAGKALLMVLAEQAGKPATRLIREQILAIEVEAAAIAEDVLADVPPLRKRQP